MKTFKLVVLSFLMSLYGWQDLSAQPAITPGIRLAVKASTNGLGADAVYSFHKRMDIRLGFEIFSVKTSFVFQEEKVDYDTNVKIKTGSISLLYDFYLADHVFLTAGAGWNLFHTVFDGVASSFLQFGDIQIPKEDIGTFNFQVEPSLRVSPYLGVGFGWPLGVKKKLGCALELGGFYQGPPKITILSTGLLSPTSNPDHRQNVRLEKQINQYSIYPVIKFSVSYLIVSL